MYTYLSSRVLPNQTNAQWLDVDISMTIVRDIFVDYREIYLKLNRDGVEIFVDLNQLRTRYASYNNRLSVLLQSLGNTGLDTVAGFPEGQNHFAIYQNAFRVGYSAKLSERGVYRPPGYPRELLPDIELTRALQPTDLSLLHSHCLVSVNGYYHMTDTDGQRAWVVDGGKSTQASATGHIGIFSFVSVGKLHKEAINISAITPSDTGKPLFEGAIIHTTRPVVDNSFFLVLGGYLVFPQDQVFWQITETSFGIRLKELRYLERISESLRYINLDKLELTASVIHQQLLNVDELTSDAVIRKYFGLSQSFFVSVEAPPLFVNKKFLRQMRAPGIFTAFQEPKYPLIMGSGRAVEYWKVNEGQYWSVSAADSFYRNYIFDRQHMRTLSNVTPSNSFDRPFFYSQGMLLEVGVFKPQTP